MKRWMFCLALIPALGFGALGCGSGGSAASTVTISISPPTESVITNTNANPAFTAFVNGSSDQTAAWTLTCPTGVTAPACGIIDATTGVYTAPKTVPTVTTNGTTTVAPTATITATAHADTTKKATASVTIISGITISIFPTTATIGTGETFDQFIATVSNPGCVNTAGTTDCTAVTWSLPTTTTAGSLGTIDAKTGVYTAPGTVPTPSSVTVTVTSVKDASVTKTATITVVTAQAPTLTSVSPKTAALGSLFQDIYITGTNFISTNKVFVNGTRINGAGPDNLPLVSVVSSSVIRARVPDSLLASLPPSGILSVGVSQQAGTPVGCTPDPTQCQIVLAGVRPAIIGPSPDNIQQGGTGGGLSFGINGGFFGTNGSPAVSATFAGHLRTAQVNNARQMSVIIGGSGSGDFSTPGLYPVAIHSAADATKVAVTNLAVQPNYGSGASTISLKSTVHLPAGSAPTDVAVNPATGLAVVANLANTAADSDSVSFIDLTAITPVVGSSICTDAPGAKPLPCSVHTGPKGVAIDYINNIAYVVNSTTQTVAAVGLSTQSVISVTPLFKTPPSDASAHLPTAIGVNPITGRALVTIQNRPYGILLDISQSPPVILGPVTIGTGGNARIAVEPHLNWAISTPGGLGSIGIVDLNRQTRNVITNIARASNVVTVTVQASTAAQPQPPLDVHLNDTVFIQNVPDGTSAAGTGASLDGFYTVTGLGPQSGQFSYTQSTSGTLADVPSYATTAGTVNYAAPVATLALTNTVQGIGINPETQQVVLVDPSPNGLLAGAVSFFSLLDQTVTAVTLRTATGPVERGNVASAFNPLTNVAVVVNPTFNFLSVIDPSTPARLNNTVPFSTGSGPIAVAIDPGANLAVVANQTDNSISIISLGPIQSLSITESSPKEFVVNSTLNSVASPGVVNPLTVIGKGLTCTGGSTTAKVRLDGIPLTTSCVGTGDRELTAVVPSNLLTSARRFALDVLGTDGITVSNATDFTVKQSVDVSTVCTTSPPLPAGVAIDPVLNIAAVSLSGCNALALIDLSTGTGRAVNVGTGPIGVAALPRLHLAVVANVGGNNATVVDDSASGSVKSSPPTGSGSVGAAADQDTGEVAIANSSANTVTILNAATGGTSSISTGQRPIAVAFDYLTHQIAAAADASNSVGIANASSTSLTTSFPINVPTAVAFDPSNNTFLAASSTNNSVSIYDPTIQQQTAFLRVGINPTAMAYNYLTGTLITTNTGSHTITVADILSSRIRAVLTLPPPPVNSTLTLSGAFQFAVDIHPLTNVAVIADTANGRVLLVPVPR